MWSSPVRGPGGFTVVKELTKAKVFISQEMLGCVQPDSYIFDPIVNTCNPKMIFPRNRRQIVHSCVVGSTSDKNSGEKFHFIPTFPTGLPVLAAGMSICLSVWKGNPKCRSGSPAW